MFDRFSDRARRVLVLAQEEARLLDHGFISTEHLLLGLIGEGRGVGAQALARTGVSLEGARDEVQRRESLSRRRRNDPQPFSSQAKKLLELSYRESQQLGHDYVGTEHLLLGLVRQGDSGAVEVLDRFGVDVGQVRQAAVELLPESQEHAGSVSKIAAVMVVPSRRHHLLQPMRSWRVRMWRSAFAQRGCAHE